MCQIGKIRVEDLNVESAGCWRRRRLWRPVEWPEFRAEQLGRQQQQRSVLLSWVSDGELVRDGRESQWLQKFWTLFLGPFFKLWFRDLFGGGSVLKTIEHVSGGR